MVDSRDKGKRAEYAVRDLLREHTGLGWERVPGSGGFQASHGLKGDIYVPKVNYKHCIEVKHYADDTINSNILKNADTKFSQFWAQCTREATEIGKVPLLIFKKDRGQWLVATWTAYDLMPEIKYTNQFREKKTDEPEIDEVYIYLFKPWLELTKKEDFLDE